jgi:pimeloyl-ACP methyl ester carboxylesterase
MGRYRWDDRKSITTPAGVIEYRDIGSGEPVVFVHGALLNSALWNDVAFYLPTNLRLILLDLPLGGHRLPVAADANLTPPALGELLLDVVETFDLQEVTMVGSDIGVAICRYAVSGGDRRARRIAGLLFTNADAFGEHAPGHQFGEVALDRAGLDDIARRLPTGEGRRAFFDRLVWAPLSDEEIRDLLGGFLENAEVRENASHALETARPPPRLPGRESFEGPVKVLWGVEDDGLPVALGARLAATFVNGELREVPQARLLVPLDQPESVAEAILDILEARKPADAGSKR